MRWAKATDIALTMVRCRPLIGITTSAAAAEGAVVMGTGAAGAGAACWGAA